MDAEPQYKPYARCSICLFSYSTDDFRVLTPCGHCLCLNCIDKIFHSGKGTCPFCRNPIEQDLKDHLKPIPLDFVPDRVATTERVIDGLNRMNENSKLVSVLKTPGKLRQAAESLETDGELAHSLLQAITEFKERIVPVFKEVKQQKEDIQRLQTELQGREHQDKEFTASTVKLRSLEDKVRETRKTQRQLESERDRALDIARKATDELCTVREEKTALNDRVSTLEKEVEILKGYLQQHKEAERRNRAKRKELQRQLAEMERKDNVPNSTVQDTSTVAEQGHIDLDEDYKGTRDAKGIRRHELDPAQYHIDAQRDFEAMPTPGFSSNWMPHELRQAKKPKLANKVMEITNFPVEFDRSGRPTGLMQLGPKRKFRMRDRL